jgi:hypothetical protein
MWYLPISRSWIVSRSGQRVYARCAIADFQLIAVLVGRPTAMAESGVKSLENFPAAAYLVKLRLWPGVIGTAILAVAMWYFWFTFDRSHWATTACWSLILFLGLALGPLSYYIFAYRKSPALDPAS